MQQQHKQMKDPLSVAANEDHVLLKDTPRNSKFLVANGDKDEINWVHCGMLVIPPTMAICGALTTTLRWQTMLLSVILYFWAGMGITGGYHRLWSHKSYSATFAVRLFLMIGAATAFEGSCKWWSRNHRAHHRYTDTDKDPYNARRGFLYSHLGWMVVKQKASSVGYADITDLNRDPMILWQHRYYAQLALGVGVALPVLIASLWGDPWGGLFYACMARIVFVHHATFFVNSLAHSFGDKTFSDHHTAFDSFITAILTLGEGYHNYHHEFPQDYRNGVRFYHYDPTKWFVVFLSWFGLTYNLKWISKEDISKARLQMKQRQLDTEKAQIEYGERFQLLPEMSWEEIKKQCTEKGECLVVIQDIVHDVKNFVHEHPGGRQTLLNYVGTDATSLFNGTTTANNNGNAAALAHIHSKQARKYLYAMRVGVLRPEHKEKNA